MNVVATDREATTRTDGVPISLTILATDNSDGIALDHPDVGKSYKKRKTQLGGQASVMR